MIEIETREYLVHWKDESPDDDVFFATFAILKSKEEADATDDTLIAEDDLPEFYRWDSGIFHYIHAYEGESAEDLMTDNEDVDFILIGEAVE